MTRRSPMSKAWAVLLALVLVGAWFVAPGGAHESESISHNWSKHYSLLAKRIFYTKRQSNLRFINVGERASNAALLDGLDSTDFAAAIHAHSGDDITSGTVAEARIDALLARDAEVFGIVLAADGAGSTLDADLLDGQSSGAFAAATHAHSGDDITSGTVAEARIDALLARDAEVFGIVTGADGPGSGLDADLLDGLSSGAFAAASHAHSGDDITSGTVAEARIDALLARDAEVFGIVLAADGSASGLDADLLDGLSSGAFAAASHAHSGDDITSGTVDASVIDVLIARVADVFDIVLAADGSGSTLDADLLDGLDSSAFAAAGQSTSVQWFKETADSLASTTTSERVVFTAPENVTITNVFLEPAAALTADDANFATITVARRDANGSGQVTVATETTATAGAGGSGNWTAFSSVSLGSLSNTSLAAGQKLTVAISKSGLGVVLPILVVQIEYTID